MKPIFSGDESQVLWDRIDSISKTDINLWNTLYLLGSKLQELEARITLKNPGEEE
jgi:hypothetical protein